MGFTLKAVSPIYYEHSLLATDGTKFLVKSICETEHENPCARPPAVLQDLSTQRGMRLDWSVKNVFVNLLVRLKGNTKHISGNLLSSLLVAQKKHISAASQIFLTD